MKEPKQLEPKAPDGKLLPPIKHADALGVDHALCAGAASLKGWSRVPSVEVSEAEFLTGIEEFKKLEAR